MNIHPFETGFLNKKRPAKWCILIFGFVCISWLLFFPLWMALWMSLWNIKQAKRAPQVNVQIWMQWIYWKSFPWLLCRTRRDDLELECRPTLEPWSELRVRIEIVGFGSFWGRQYGGAVVPRELPKSPLVCCRLSSQRNSTVNDNWRGCLPGHVSNCTLTGFQEGL